MTSKRIELVDEEQALLPEVITLEDSFSLSEELIRIYTDIVGGVGYSTTPSPTGIVTIWNWAGNITKKFVTPGGSTTSVPGIIRVDRRGGFYVNILSGAGGGKTYRYNSGGVLDTSWGSSGSITANWYDVYIRADDSIYSIGTDYLVQHRDKYGNLIWYNGTGGANFRCIDVEGDYIYIGMLDTGLGADPIIRRNIADGSDAGTVPPSFGGTTECIWLLVDEEEDIYYACYTTGVAVRQLSTGTLISSVTSSATIRRPLYHKGFLYVPSGTTTPAIMGDYSGRLFKLRLTPDSVTVVRAFQDASQTVCRALCIDQHERIWAGGATQDLIVLSTDFDVLYYPSVTNGDIFANSLASIPNSREVDLGFLP